MIVPKYEIMQANGVHENVTICQYSSLGPFFTDLPRNGLSSGREKVHAVFKAQKKGPLFTFIRVTKRSSSKEKVHFPYVLGKKVHFFADTCVIKWLLSEENVHFSIYMLR